MEEGPNIDLPPSPRDDHDPDRNNSENSEPNGDFTLHEAVSIGNLEVAELLLVQGADVNLIDRRGRSAFHLAALTGNTSMISLLRDHYADVSTADNFTETALHMAARLGHEMVVEKLLEYGIEIDARTVPLQTSLHLAVSYGHRNIVTLLLNCGAGIEAQDKDFARPIHLAAFNGYTEILLLLLEKDANINAPTITLRTALHLAAHKGNKQIVELLLEKGADANLLDKNERTPLHIAAKESWHEIVYLLIRHVSFIDAVDLKSRTALHLAAISGNVESAVKLLNHSASIDSVDMLSETALHMAVGSKHAEMATLLLQRGANVDAIDGDSRTALSVAVMCGYQEILEILLEYGAAIDSENPWLHNPLHLAASSQNKEIAFCLLRRGAKVNHVDSNSRTALHLAVSTKYTRMVALLLNHGADPNLMDATSTTPFEIALLQGDEEIVDKLLPYVTDMNSKLSTGNPPLVEAIERGQIQIVRLLIANNADLEIVNEDGCTPLLIAAENYRLDIISLLIEKSVNKEVSDKNSMTALHWAAKHGDADFVDLLLSNTTNTEKKNRDGKTALYISTELNHRNAVMALVRHGVCVNCKDQDGITAVHKATLLGHAEIVSILMDAGATVDGKDDHIAALLDIASGAGHKNVVETILSKVKNSGSPIDYMSSTLLNAAECGKLDVVLLLLDCHADIETKDKYGRTPLFLAGKYPDLVATLVNRGSYTEARTLRGYTPIHYYTALGHLKSLRLLLNLGCHISSLDYESQTALHHAVKGDDLIITQLVVSRGIDLDAWDYNGHTAIHIAIQKNYIDIVDVIVKTGIDIDTSDHRIPRSTPLKMAIDLEREEIVELLINHGANVKCMLGDQNSLPLHLAASKLNPKLVSMILNADADPNLVGYDGYSPLQSLIYALQKKISCGTIPNKHTVLEVTTLLLKAGADTSQLHTPRQIKSLYPEVADHLSKLSSIPLHQHQPSGWLPIISHSNHYRAVGSLKEILSNAETGCLSVLSSTTMMDDVMNKYSTGFPSSRELKLDKFKVVNEAVNPHNNDFAVMSMGFKITHSMSKDDRATRIISSLIQEIGARFYYSNNFFVVNLPETNNYIAPRWAFNFNSMRGVVRQSPTLYVQIPQIRTELSVPGWYRNENPLLRFIDAVYVCRRSTPDHLDKDVFSDILGGTEERLAIHLHAILIAGLCILSVAEGPQLIEKLVNSILGLKADPNRNPVSGIPPTDWQILNRIKCDCKSPFPHRPLTPVAAAKAVGIQIWRNPEHEAVTRVWDLINDKLVQDIDISHVTFMTHKWCEPEVQYHAMLEQISTKSAKLQHIRDTLLQHTRYVWLDTICIDKANLSELDRTIRSMYKWYSNCQAVVLDSGTPLKDWCKRGWCLQEGAAAGVLYGMSKDDKLMTIQELAKEQNVNLCILDLHLYYRHGNAAEILARMNVRETTREEDMTYALAGIFQIHLTASYGARSEPRERLLYELAKKKGDLSFLSFPTIDTNNLNHLPNPSDVNFLIASCINSSTPTNDSHHGICIEVQLVQGAGAKMVLGMLSRWQNLRIFHGKSAGIPELIATAEKLEYRNSTDIEIAVVHEIRSIILVKIYGEDRQTGGTRPIKLCFRLQCCQIEEDEFERLFDDLDVDHERIWLNSKPNNATISRLQQKRKRRSTIKEQPVITFREPESEGCDVTDQELAAKRLKVSLHDFLVDKRDQLTVT